MSCHFDSLIVPSVASIAESLSYLMEPSEAVAAPSKVIVKRQYYYIPAPPPPPPPPPAGHGAPRPPSPPSPPSPPAYNDQGSSENHS